MQHVPADLVRRLETHNQEHLLRGWDDLAVPQRVALTQQLAGLDLALIERLYARRDEVESLPPASDIRPIPVVEPQSVSADDVRLGHESLLRGEVAVLLVAGGQGTRLGFDRPKGMYPIGPVTQRSLFAIHAHKVLALRRRYGRAIPFLIMTSPITDIDTREYFAANDCFGLPHDEVHFFCQGTMPAVDIDTGRILLEAPGVLFASPNGHGGTLTALADSGLLDDLRSRGIRTVFYLQVDNPLVRIADPVFLGAHIAARSEASSRSIDKAFPKEKMGVLALLRGRCGIIEYSDLPDDLAHALDADGRLSYSAGSPAVHLFDVDFLTRVTRGETRLPFHVARKKVPCLNDAGEFVQPTRENALKFEMFVFDALPMADRWLTMRTTREEEFAPLKNATGADSPESVRQSLSNLYHRWLVQAGATVPMDDAGNAAVALEVAPTFALDGDEMQARLMAGQTIDAPRVW